MVDVPPLVVDRAAGTPLAVQLADGLREATADGALRAGDRLPSTRELAALLGVSRTVTAGAYDQLLAEGWLEGRRGVGTFVVGTPQPAPSPARAARVTPAADVVDLRPGAPCLE
ncbi:MAG: transcriptional regulator, GntR family with aminotransferase domain, partial [Klenkia sp.]|nr:transcriptional regulator, GntR family with aminotransferase domain [Klenkia sp.]